ncbi:MAG: TonB-dependent receptor [Pseudomonadota bacterium]
MTFTNSALRSTSIVAVAMSLLSVPALAQDQDAGDDTARRLQAVTVTSTKRETTLQDIPVAVSVTDAQTIDRAAINDIKDLQSVVPSLRVQTRQNGPASNFFIRGFGNGAQAIGIEPSVGVFVDGVYRSRSGAAISDLPNVERIEVLRGPQSTLFGKNASAGVISVVTRAPTFELGGSAELTLGNFNQVQARGSVNIPIVEDMFAMNLSGQFNQRDGFVDNLFDGSDVNNRDRWGIRADFLFEPNDQTSLRLIIDHDEIDELCCAGLNIVDGPANGIITAIGGQTVAGRPFDREIFQDLPPIQDIQNSGLSLQGDFEFDAFTLTSITSYRENEIFSHVDTDFTSAQVFGFSPRDYSLETFTQEVRLTSTGDGPLDWMVGGFYFDEEFAEDALVIFGPDGRAFVDIALGGLVGAIESNPLSGVAPGTFFANDTGSRETFGQSNTSYSLFGQFDYALTDRFTATVGLNYTEDEKDAFVRSVLPLDPWSNNPLVAGTPLAFLPELVAFPNATEDGQSTDDKVTWTLRGAYDLTDNVNIYATAATGFKATSWSLGRDSRPGTRFARPEDTMVYEIGMKAQWDTVGVNLAVFDQTIEDFQVSIFTGTSFAFLNAPEQSTTGAEIEVNWAPTEDLTLVFAGTFLDPVYDNFPNANLNNVPTDLSGQQPAGISDTNLSISGNYDFNLTASIDGFVRADYQYESDVQVEENTGDLSREVSTFNASAGLDFNNGWAAQIWGRNIFDDEYITGAFPPALQAGSVNGYPNDPPTYGVTVRKTF